MTGQPPIPFGACAHWLSASRAFAPQQKKGDWVAGLGSRNAPSGDLSRWLLYAMRVEEILSLQEYDRRTRTDWPHRIPNAGSADLAERLGDHIYDFSGGTPVQRPGVHGPGNVDTDLDGKMSWYRVTSTTSAAGPFHCLTICSPSVTRAEGTRAQPMPAILIKAICGLAARAGAYTRSAVRLARFHCRLGRSFVTRRLYHSPAGRSKRR